MVSYGKIGQRERWINVDLVVVPGMKLEPGFISGLTSANITPESWHWIFANVGLTNGEINGP